MKVCDLITDQSFKLVVQGDVNQEIDGFYSGDLLSWVMSHAQEKNAWMTVLTHINIIAVAHLLALSCVIIVENAEIEADTIKKAQQEKINLIKTDLSAVDVIHKLLISRD